MNKPNLLLNPAIRWAVHPADQDRIAYVEGTGAIERGVPKENELLTRPFLVDPQTRQPVPVRVVQVVEMWDTARSAHTLAVVVARAQ